MCGYDIAKLLCTPSELKKTDYGRKLPNSTEDWLDVQARALYQAYMLIANLFNKLIEILGGEQVAEILISYMSSDNYYLREIAKDNEIKIEDDN